MSPCVFLMGGILESQDHGNCAVHSYLTDHRGEPYEVQGPKSFNCFLGRQSRRQPTSKEASFIQTAINPPHYLFLGGKSSLLCSFLQVLVCKVAWLKIAFNFFGEISSLRCLLYFRWIFFKYFYFFGGECFFFQVNLKKQALIIIIMGARTYYSKKDKLLFISIWFKYLFGQVLGFSVINYIFNN